MSGRQGLRSASSRAAPPHAGQGRVAAPVPEKPRAKSAHPKKPSSTGKRAREAAGDAGQPGQVATLSAEEEQLQWVLFGDGAKTTTCVVCCTEGVEWSAGVECPAGHFSCRGCVEKLLAQSLKRDPSAVDAPEKEKKCYHVKCTATDDDGCGLPFRLKELATVLPTATFDRLQAKNVELAVHLRMPDAVKEHLAAAAASTGPQTTAQYEVDVRAAFRRPDGTFRDETGCRVKQCTECGFGPVLKIKCDDMAAHHGDIVRDRRDGSIVYRQDMSCGHCGHLNRSNWATWPDWTGERVLGAVPPVRETGAAAGPSAPAVNAPVGGIQAAGEVVRRTREAAQREAVTAARLEDQWRLAAQRLAATRAPGGGIWRAEATRAHAAAQAALESARQAAARAREAVRIAGAPPPVCRSGPSNQPPSANQPPPAPPPPPPLVPGDRVRVRRAVDPPHFGWGGVTHESVGTLLSTGDPHRVTVDMPGRHNAWLAELHELEHAAPRELAVGDRVRVRRAVRVPRFGWGSVDHDSVGTLLSVDHSRPVRADRVTATVRFPGYDGTWNAAVEELESADGAEAPPPPPPRRPAEDRARTCGVGDEHQKLVGMGFEGEASLEAIVRAARSHRDAPNRMRAAVADLVQRSA